MKSKNLKIIDIKIKEEQQTKGLKVCKKNVQLYK